MKVKLSKGAYEPIRGHEDDMQRRIHKTRTGKGQE